MTEVKLLIRNSLIAGDNLYVKSKDGEARMGKVMESIYLYINERGVCTFSDAICNIQVNGLGSEVKFKLDR